MEFFIILFLIIINGVFAMTEIAIVSARKSKLQHLATSGDIRAKKALELSRNPNRFLSTIQIGITFVGIFAGAFGAETLTIPVARVIGQIPIVTPYSDGIALFLVVLLITYLSLIIGELVPKRIALSNPEQIASLAAYPIQALSTISKPIVDMLSFSMDGILRIIGITSAAEMPVTEEEVKLLIREGARVGIFNLAERDIVERTFRLADQQVNMLMTPRKDIVWLDIEEQKSTLRHTLSNHSYSYLPVCKGKLDKVLGVVRMKELLTNYLKTETIDVMNHLHKTIYLPETMNALKVLELFKKSGIHVGLVVDEYGNITGLLSITDILIALVGNIPTVNDAEEQTFIKRKDGSWLVNGLATIDECKDQFHIKTFPGEATGQFQTIGGFVMHKLGRIPVAGDTIKYNNLYIEVVDMDNNRVDKLLIKNI